jgi:putative salt-induced outer membrane protein YdiY
MIARHVGMSVLFATLAASSAAMAQAPAAPAPLYTGNLGGGLAITIGNTDTRNINLTGAVVRDSKTRNVIKGTGSYLRGTQSDVVNLDRTSINIRDEYTISHRTFVFGQLDYLRDQFKEMIFFWAPTGGIGYKLINTDATQFIVNGGAGGVLEKNPGIPVEKVRSSHFGRAILAEAVLNSSVHAIPGLNLEDERFWRFAHKLLCRYNNDSLRQDSTEARVCR